MNASSNAFWRTYRRDAIMGWIYLIATPVVPISVGLVNHFLLGATPIISSLAEVIGLVPFLLFGYYSWKYKFAVCPHCNQTAAKFRNLVFPIDPICPKCGRRMDIDDKS